MTDIELNKLGVKSDSLPDNWLVTLVNPTTGAVAENMTLARFVELLTDKMPVVTRNSKGVMPYGTFGTLQTAINSDKIIKVFDDQKRFNGILFVNDKFASFALSVINNWGSFKITNLTGDKNSDIKIKRKDHNLYVYSENANNDLEVSGIATKGTLSLTLEDYDSSAGLNDVF